MNQRYCNGIIHVIKEGDNLYQISRQHRVPLGLILRANPYVDVYNLQPGQEICIPVARPYPGMMPPPPFGGRPPMGHGGGRPPMGPGGGRPPMEQEPPMEEERMEEPVSPVSENRPMDREPSLQEDYVDDSMPDVGEAESMSEEQEASGCSAMKEYVCPAGKSLGEILREQDLSISDILENNSPDSLIMAEGTTIYVAKKV